MPQCTAIDFQTGKQCTRPSAENVDQCSYHANKCLRLNRYYHNICDRTPNMDQLCSIPEIESMNLKQLEEYASTQLKKLVGIVRCKESRRLHHDQCYVAEDESRKNHTMWLEHIGNVYKHCEKQVDAVYKRINFIKKRLENDKARIQTAEERMVEVENNIVTAKTEIDQEFSKIVDEENDLFLQQQIEIAKKEREADIILKRKYLKFLIKLPFQQPIQNRFKDLILASRKIPGVSPMGWFTEYIRALLTHKKMSWLEDMIALENHPDTLALARTIYDHPDINDGSLASDQHGNPVILKSVVDSAISRNFIFMTLPILSSDKIKWILDELVINGPDSVLVGAALNDLILNSTVEGQLVWDNMNAQRARARKK